ncbi:MAG: hypothetical protein KA974_02315 [Saprospiraceae bacterium]|nr:hypothetical protein [Saprospiraceae bacterium]MBP7699045.1 hypothetical protein [Saprospiraceae bacterium]
MRTNKTNKLGVVYLSYVPYGTYCFEQFIMSYIKFEANFEHELIILFKGFDHISELSTFNKILYKNNIKVRAINVNIGLDIDSYSFAANCLNYKYLVFFNSNSVILYDKWLSKMYEAIIKPNVGVVGCTAGWGAFGRDTGVLKRNIGRLFSKLSDKNNPTINQDSFGKSINTRHGFFQKLLMYIARKINFSESTMAHIRTNAFMIKRELFISLAYNNPTPQILFKFLTKDQEIKFKTICFEHGKNSMTNQLLRKGYLVLVVDKNGKTYEKKDWRDSNTFWYGNQENLLISDNQTRHYELASITEKVARSYSAWGDGTNYI